MDVANAALLPGLLTGWVVRVFGVDINARLGSGQLLGLLGDGGAPLGGAPGGGGLVGGLGVGLLGLGRVEYGYAGGGFVAVVVEGFQ